MNRLVPVLSMMVVMVLPALGADYPDGSRLSVEPTAESGTFLENTNPLLNYYLYLPPGHGSDPQATYPLVVFLHSAIEASKILYPTALKSTALSNLSNSLESGRSDSVQKKLAALEPHLKGALILVPHNGSDDSWRHEDVHTLVGTILKAYHGDPARVYLVGSSYGGDAALAYAAAYPAEVAAIAPMAGHPTVRASLVRGVPQWIFHAWDDPSYPVESYWDYLSKLPVTVDDVAARLPKMPQAGTQTVTGTDRWGDWKAGDQREPGGLWAMTILPSGGHPIWRRAYETAGFWDWLFAQHRP